MVVNILKAYVCKHCKNITEFKVKYDLPRIHHLYEFDLDLAPNTEIYCSYCKDKRSQLVVDKICSISCSILMSFGIKLCNATKGKSMYYRIESGIRGEVKPTKFSMRNFIKDCLIYNKQKEDIGIEYKIFKNVFKIFITSGFTSYMYNEEDLLYVHIDSLDEFDDMISKYEYVDFIYEPEPILPDANTKEVNNMINSLFEQSIMQVEEKLQHLFRENKSFVRKQKDLQRIKLYTCTTDIGYRGDNNYDNDDDE